MQVYGPQGLGKLEMGGHPRRLSQEQDPALALQQAQQQSREAGQNLQQQDLPAEKEVTQDSVGQTVIQLQQGQAVAQDRTQQQQQDVLIQQGNQQQQQQQPLDEQPKVLQGQQAAQQGQQAAGRGDAKADPVTHSVPIKKPDCFAAFNPPTVAEYQEVTSPLNLDIGTGLVLVLLSIACLTYVCTTVALQTWCSP